MQQEQRPPERERESIWSVAKGWLPWYLLLVIVLFFGWTALVAWNETTYGSYPALGPLIQGIVKEVSGGVIAIVLFAFADIIIADTAGGFIMVTYRYLNNKFVEPLRRQLREEGVAEGREQGIEEGIEQGVAAGRSQANARSREWYARQQEAWAKGEPFDEPPPFIDSPNGKEPPRE